MSLFQPDYKTTLQIELFKTKLQQQLKITTIDEFNTVYERFINHLQRNDAVIAGGFVLSCYNDYISSDIDIYVSETNANKLITKLSEIIKVYPVDFQIVSIYNGDGSNNIKRLIFKNKLDEIDDTYRIINTTGPTTISIDVIIIDTSSTILETIKNFDLSFCKIWTDGQYIYAIDEKSIMTKHGSLNPKYYEDYQDISSLIYNRVIKYKERGFTIDIPSEGEETHQPIYTPFQQIQMAEIKTIKFIITNFRQSAILRALCKEHSNLDTIISTFIPSRLFVYEIPIGTQTRRQLKDLKKRNLMIFHHNMTLITYYFYNLFRKFTLEEYIFNIKRLLPVITDNFIYKIINEILNPILLTYVNITINPTIDDKLPLITIETQFPGDPLIYTNSFAKNCILFYLIKRIFTHTNYSFQQQIIDSDLFNIFTNIHILPNDERQIQEIMSCDEVQCSIYGTSYKDVESYLKKDKNNIIIVPPEEKTLMFITRSDLDKLISNKNDNWYYDCNVMNDPTQGDNYLISPYIYLPIGQSRYYIKYNYLYSVFNSKQQIFFIKRCQEPEIQKTASFKNTREGQKHGLQHFVGANHCQDGTNITISEIYGLHIETIKQKTKSNSNDRKIRTRTNIKNKSN